MREKSMSVLGKGNSILCLVPLGKRADKEKGVGFPVLNHERTNASYTVLMAYADGSLIITSRIVLANQRANCDSTVNQPLQQKQLQ